MTCTSIKLSYLSILKLLLSQKSLKYASHLDNISSKITTDNILFCLMLNKFHCIYQCPLTGGFYCAGGGITYPTTPCSAGYYCRYGAVTSTPTQYPQAAICPTGRYCPTQTDEPITCPVGTWSNTTGLRNVTECTPCLPGQYHHRMLQLSTELVFWSQGYIDWRLYWLKVILIEGYIDWRLYWLKVILIEGYIDWRLYWLKVILIEGYIEFRNEGLLNYLLIHNYFIILRQIYVTELR